MEKNGKVMDFSLVIAFRCYYWMQKIFIWGSAATSCRHRGQHWALVHKSSFFVNFLQILRTRLTVSTRPRCLFTASLFKQLPRRCVISPTIQTPPPFRTTSFVFRARGARLTSHWFFYYCALWHFTFCQFSCFFCPSRPWFQLLITSHQSGLIWWEAYGVIAFRSRAYCADRLPFRRLMRRRRK